MRWCFQWLTEDVWQLFTHEGDSNTRPNKSVAECRTVAHRSGCVVGNSGYLFRRVVFCVRGW